MDLVDECVKAEDSDRSKMLRRALEEKLAKQGGAGEPA
jgi:metal-responsive CopG/Arc/MetJ family transcriptional regulator